MKREPVEMSTLTDGQDNTRRDEEVSTLTDGLVDYSRESVKDGRKEGDQWRRCVGGVVDYRSMEGYGSATMLGKKEIDGGLFIDGREEKTYGGVLLWQRDKERERWCL
ncbi:hypothetical protein R6Q59_009733 [Mikania micrantha]|uniref:Uncharacterized protein n=1 Tax=Mikania micrantha TaxID=192012 RepID=A0A5N6N7B0_9ASTR|nr:hypothetical protein E3N88_26156 [Mikania micrantha]